MATISFTTTFDLTLTPKQFIFEDTSDYAGQGITTSDVNGSFKITSPSGIVIYNNTDYTPSGCDIEVAAALTNQTTLGLPLATDGFPEIGTYTIIYTVYDSNAAAYYTITNTYTNNYVQPEVEITQTVDCLSPLFTSIDATDYTVDGTDPVITRTHTIDYPFGSAGEGSPTVGATATVTSSLFWNGTQTTEIESDLVYTFPDGLIVIDAISGVEEILVDCTDTCGIFCCARTLKDRMIAYKTTNAVLYAETTALFNQVMGLIGFISMAIRCGKSVEISGVLTVIKSLANCTDDCSCADGTPTQVIGIGGLTTITVVDSADPNFVIVTPSVVGNTTTYYVAINPSFLTNANKIWTRTIANDAARAAAVPNFDGQLGVQLNTETVYSSTGTSAGSWSQVNYFKSGGGVNSLMSKNAANALGVNSLAVGVAAESPGNISIAIGSTSFSDGDNSNAIGVNARSTGDDSTAFGSGPVSAGDSSVAIGHNVSSPGDNSNAIGYGAIATGDNSNAIGKDAAATVIDTIAIGNTAIASGNYSMAIGKDATADQTDAVAIGRFAQALAALSISIGQSASSTGDNAVSVGYGANASADNAVCLGKDSVGGGDDASALGHLASAAGQESVAIGKSASAPTGGAISVGPNAVTIGSAAIAIGSGATGPGDQGIAIGVLATASGDNTFVVGGGSTASGNESTSIGYISNATAQGALAIGQGALASAAGAMALGSSTGISSTTASAAYSITIGVANESTAVDAISVGRESASSGIGAIVVGADAIAGANGAVAIGLGAEANGVDSVAIGASAIANIDQTVNLSGTIITRKDSGETPYNQFFSGAIVTIATPEIDLKTVADYTITLPTGSMFFPDEVDLILTTINNVTGQPTVRAGGDVSTSSLLAAIGTTALTAQFDRQRFATLLTSKGQATLSAGVTIAATGTTVKGRFQFSGRLVENE